MADDPEPVDAAARELVAAAAAGERGALEQLIAAQMPALRAFIRRRMGPALRRREDSMDLVQSACRQALRGLTDFEYRGEAEFRDWLFTTTMNKLMDRLRHQLAAKRDPGREVPLEAQPLPSALTPSRHAMAREQAARVQAAFDGLPEAQREVILLSRLMGLSHAEIAQRLGRSEGAVRNLLYRGLTRLSFVLDRSGQRPDSSSS